MGENKFNGFSGDSAERYMRQLTLPEVGEEGQRKLLGSKVLIVGAGGLGSPNAIYLCAAGVGTIGIVDDDRVELSNLHRQVLHGTRDLERPKVESAGETLRDINPEVEVIPHRERLTSRNAMEVVGEYDLAVDCCDSFATRYLVNDACVMLGRPYVYGSVFRFEGQASLFVPGEGACYRCLFPVPPPADVIPPCREAGLFGFLPGVIGLIQTTEAIKQILGIGETLRSRLLLYDALKMDFRFMKTSRDPKCAVCGDNPKITQMSDYDKFYEDHFGQNV